MSANKTNLSKSPVLKEDLAKVKLVLDGLEADPQAYAFLEPVEYKSTFL